MDHALIWLLTIEILGLISFPLAFCLFRRLPDRGFSLSKLLALLLSSYILWILGLTHLIPNSQYTIIGILVLIAVASALVLKRRLPEMVSFLRRERTSLLVIELVFLGLYLLWITVVSYSPAINHTEKPMDFAFLNAILKSTYFPPEDPWLAGHSISYYYFGHFMMATLTKLTAIPSSVSYNLSIAVIASLAGAAAFGLVYNLIRLSGGAMRSGIVFGLAAPLFLVLIGNLEGVLEFVHSMAWGSVGFWEWVSIKGLDGGLGGASSFFPKDYWWWWHATRVIDTVVDGISLDYTITEFPFFSFLLGDLHPHVTSLPFLIFNLALGLNLFISRELLGLGWLRRNAWEVFAITLFLGSLGFINIWDFPIFAVIFAALVLIKSYADWGGDIKRALLPALTLVLPVLAGAVLLYLPFYMTLSSQASGISAVGEVSTRPLFFFLIWGLFLVVSGSFLLRQLWNVPQLLSAKNSGILSFLLVIILLPFLLWAGWQVLALLAGFDLFLSVLSRSIVDDVSTVGIRFAILVPGLAMVGVALYSILLRARHGNERPMIFVLLPLALAIYLLAGAELFYVVDLFGNRMNTVFKVYYQAWLLLAIVSAYGLYYCWTQPITYSVRLRIPLRLPSNTVKYSWRALVVVLLLASIYYPVGAARDRARDFDGDSSLDGLAFLRGRNSGEYESIIWLRDEAPRGRIVEAVGDDYSEYGRISSSTGLPTMLGWKGHEHQWRGSTTSFQGREQEVEMIYSSSDPEEVRRLLSAYDIRYVYVGPRERSDYGDGQFEKFSSFLEPVFREKDVVIYERLQDG